MSITQIIVSPCAWMEYNIPADCWQNSWSGIKYSAFLLVLLPCCWRLTANGRMCGGWGQRSERQCVSYCSLEIRVLHVHSLDWLTSISWIVQIEVGMRSCTSQTGFWRLTSFSFDSRLSWICHVVFFVKPSHSHFNFRSRTLLHEQLGAGWSAPQKFQGLIVRSHSLIGLRLDDCSKAVQLLLDTIIAARIKWFIGRQNLPDSFSLQNKIFMYISSTWKCSTHYFLRKSFICSLYSCIGSRRKVAVPLLHMNNIQTRLLIYQQNLKLTPGFSQYSFTSLNFTNSVHKSLSNKIETHWQGKGSHAGLQNN